MQGYQTGARPGFKPAEGNSVRGGHGGITERTAGLGIGEGLSSLSLFVQQGAQAWSDAYAAVRAAKTIGSAPDTSPSGYNYANTGSTFAGGDLFAETGMHGREEYLFNSALNSGARQVKRLIDQWQPYLVVGGLAVGGWLLARAIR